MIRNVPAGLPAGFFRSGVQIGFQVLPGIALFHLGHFLRGAGGDHITTAAAALRTQINDIICGFDHIQIVFNHQNRVAGIHQSLQDINQFMNVRCM